MIANKVWAKRVILVDFDGVMTDFTQAFDLNMAVHGYSDPVKLDCYSLADRYGNEDPKAVMDELHRFVESDVMSGLPPVNNSLKWVRALREDGFLFHCITKFPRERAKLRLENAERLYGRGVFQVMECVGVTGSKSPYLQKYEGTGCFWVEDCPEQALLGLEYGLRPILMHHEYNSTFHHPHITRVKDWAEVYELAKEHYADEF